MVIERVRERESERERVREREDGHVLYMSGCGFWTASKSRADSSTNRWL